MLHLSDLTLFSGGVILIVIRDMRNTDNQHTHPPGGRVNDARRDLDDGALASRRW